MKFNIGDRVVCTVNNPDDNEHIIAGDTGVIKFTGGHKSYEYAVEFDRNIDGHTAHGYTKDGYGWWMGERHLALFTYDSEDEEFEIDEETDPISMLMGFCP